MVLPSESKHCYSSALFLESKFALAKASQLPEILEGEKRDLKEEESLLEKERYNREKQFWLCYKVMAMDVDTQLIILLQRPLLAFITLQWCCGGSQLMTRFFGH